MWKESKGGPLARKEKPASGPAVAGGGVVSRAERRLAGHWALVSILRVVGAPEEF